MTGGAVAGPIFRGLGVLLLQVLREKIVAVEPYPTLLTKSLGLLQSRYRLVQLAAVVMEHGQQVQPVAQVLVTVAREDRIAMRIIWRRYIMQPLDEGDLTPPVRDGPGQVAFAFVDERAALLAPDRLLFAVRLEQRLVEPLGIGAGALRLLALIEPVQHLVVQVADFVPKV